jgi:hypothetical protein
MRMSPFCKYIANISICGLLSGKNTGNFSIIGQELFKILAPCPINTGMYLILQKFRSGKNSELNKK